MGLCTSKSESINLYHGYFTTIFTEIDGRKSWAISTSCRPLWARGLLVHGKTGDGGACQRGPMTRALCNVSSQRSLPCVLHCNKMEMGWKNGKWPEMEVSPFQPWKGSLSIRVWQLDQIHLYKEMNKTVTLFPIWTGLVNAWGAATTVKELWHEVQRPAEASSLWRYCDAC